MKSIIAISILLLYSMVLFRPALQVVDYYVQLHRRERDKRRLAHGMISLRRDAGPEARVSAKTSPSARPVARSEEPP